jgi:hypothetical protein
MDGWLNHAVLSTALTLIVFHAVSAQQSSSLNRIVGPDIFGTPLVITKLTGESVGALAVAARVAMGFEAVTATEAARSHGSLC